MQISTRYQWLEENTRHKRRSITDAIEVLATLPSFVGAARARILVEPFLHLYGQTAYLINLQFQADKDLIFVVSLPAAVKCQAITDSPPSKTEFDIESLDGATADVKATVHLRNGSILRCVEVIPANLPYNPTKLEWRIIRALVSMHDAEMRCFPFLCDKAPAEIRHMIPAQLRMPDCQAISQLKAPPLKVLKAHLADIDPTLNISAQKIADTLAIFGVRPVTPRPRKAARRNSAIV